MKRVKVQFEIRYTPILDFTPSYRKLLNPYLKLPNIKFNIENIDTLREIMILNFHEDLYSIDCRFDRMILLAEGNDLKLDDPNGPLKLFTDIFEKIKSFETFGNISSTIISYWSVTLFENQTSEEVIRKFKEDYLATKISSFAKPFDNITDTAIVIEHDDANQFSRLRFGPLSVQDAQRLNLSPFESKENSYLYTEKGILSEIFLSEKEKRPDFSLLAKLLKTAESLSKGIHQI